MAHILIIGGGEFGLTSALALRQRGWQVTLLDAGEIPRPTAASTDINKVVRMDYGYDDLHTRLGEQAIEGWHRWNHDWQTQLYHEDGFLVLTRHEFSTGSFEADSFSFLTNRGHQLKQLNADEIAARYPAWAKAGYRHGYLNPRGGWAASGYAMAVLATKARSAGVTIHEHQRFHSLLEKGARVHGVTTTDGSSYQADFILMATGAWTPTLLPHLQSVMWATGQPVFHFQVSSPRDYQAPHFPVWAGDIARTGWYGFPSLSDGTLKIANHGPGRRIHPDAPREVTDAEIAMAREFLRQSLPQLADAPLINTRLCLYCDTFDGRFWIDHDAHHPGLIIAAGDSGHAFKFAPVLGHLIADVVEEKANPDTLPFHARQPKSSANEGARWSGQ